MSEASSFEADVKTFLGLKDADFSDFVTFAVFQALRAQLEDVTKFALAVENIESLLIDKLEQDYYAKVNAKIQELEEQYGNRDEDRIIKIKELATFKFRELIKYIKKGMPEEIEGVL